jgi:hypothetical protein
MPAVSFDADSLKDVKSTYVMLNAENGVMKGHFEQRATYSESCNLRKYVSAKSVNEYFRPFAKSFSMETKLSNTEIEDLDNYESPVKIKYDFEMAPESSDILYINPIFTESVTENPFKSHERLYPVEMPYVINEVYTMNMSVPDGFEVAELPKSAIVNFNETEGQFQYFVQVDNNRIQLRLKLVLAKATFSAEDYNALRDFYDMIVKKQAEQIVLKKK